MHASVATNAMEYSVMVCHAAQEFNQCVHGPCLISCQIVTPAIQTSVNTMPAAKPSKAPVQNGGISTSRRQA